ncbi:3-oxoacyl-ACP synthase [Aquirufa sp. ROCK2-A2]
MQSKELKGKLIDLIKEDLKKKIEEMKRDFQLARESRNSDTKSSAGDKFETGREMMQKEMDKCAMMIDMHQLQLNTMDQIKELKTSTKIEKGSLIQTNQGNYLLSIGLGKLELEGKPYFVISTDSPIGSLLKGKKTGDKIVFRGNTIEILQII